jgi:hypothetical protein
MIMCETHSCERLADRIVWCPGMTRSRFACRKHGKQFTSKEGSITEWIGAKGKEENSDEDIVSQLMRK